MISVALIEDNRLVREGISALLNQLPDLEVVSGTSSGDTLLLKSVNPQVVLLDIGLRNGDSLRVAEKVKKEFPEAKVVKTLNTTNALVMVNPDSVAGGDHTMFVCGNDQSAKDSIRALLESFGWRDIIDIGDITSARGSEMILPMWVRLMGSFGPSFNFKIAR